MKKLLIYAAIYALLLVLKLTGVIVWPWYYFVLIPTFLFWIIIALIAYGWYKGSRDAKRTRKFWDLYRQDHESINQEEDEY